MSKSLLPPMGMTMGGPTGGEMIMTMLELLWVAEELCSLLETELRDACNKVLVKSGLKYF